VTFAFFDATVPSRLHCISKHQTRSDKYSAPSLHKPMAATLRRSALQLVQAASLGDAAAVLEMLASGAPIDAQDGAGVTVLMATIERGDTALLRRLLDWKTPARANLELRTRDGWTALHTAVVNNQVSDALMYRWHQSMTFGLNRAWHVCDSKMLTRYFIFYFFARHTASWIRFSC
jgi:ankyrin repeat protein